MTIDQNVTGQRLRALLAERGMSRREFAELVGVHRNSIENYVAGRTRPLPVILALMADVLGVSVAYLEGESADPT